MARLSWLAPHPDMMMAPDPKGGAMLKIVREDGGFTLYRQTNEGMAELSRHASKDEAKQAAEAL